MKDITERIVGVREAAKLTKLLNKNGLHGTVEIAINLRDGELFSCFSMDNNTYSVWTCPFIVNLFCTKYPMTMAQIRSEVIKKLGVDVMRDRIARVNGYSTKEKKQLCGSCSLCD